MGDCDTIKDCGCDCDSLEEEDDELDCEYDCIIGMLICDDVESGCGVGLATGSSKLWTRSSNLFQNVDMSCVIDGFIVNWESWLSSHTQTQEIFS